MAEDKANLRLISRATMAVCIGAFGYLGIVYNFVFLLYTLPAAGRASLVPFLGVTFNTLFFLTAWSYVKAHCADPGRIPERWLGFVRGMGDNLPVAPARPEWQPGKATFCKKCDAARPERAHHCTICQACVLRMDHHCPWIGNCVGFKNQKFFLLLAAYGCLGSAFGFVTVLPQLVDYAVAPLVHPYQLPIPQATQATASPQIAALAPPPPAMAATTIATTTSSLATPVFAATPSTTPSTTPPPAATLTAATESGFPSSLPVFETEETSAEPLSAEAPAASGDFWRSLRAARGDLGGRALTGSDGVAKASAPGEPSQDGALLFGFGVLSCMVASLLASLLSSHFPLALSNVTTIEENYENMHNPFDHGRYMKNLAQTLGHFGVDWFLPVAPFKPISDGVSYPRPDEEPLHVAHGLEPEDIWKLRYAAYPRHEEPDKSMRSAVGFFEPLSRWWQGAF